MAYKIVKGKVTHISSPINLSTYQKRRIRNASTPVKMLTLIEKIKKIQHKEYQSAKLERVGY